MGFAEKLKNLLNFNKRGSMTLGDCDIEMQVAELYVHKLALHVCKKLIKDAIAKCEFKTYEGNKKTKKDEYYLWNIQPNRNQNKYEFISDILDKMLTDGEALVVERSTAKGGEELLCAEFFDKEESSTIHDKYKNVKTRGNKVWENTFSDDKVLFFKYSNQRIDALMAGVCDLYTKLFNYALLAQKKNSGQKYKFTYPSLPVAGSSDEAVFQDLLKNKFKKWLLDDISIVPLGLGQDVELLDSSASGKSGTSGHSEISGMIDKVFTMYFHAFGIPLQFYTSAVDGVDGAYKQFMTNAVMPIVRLLQCEINRKRYDKEEYLSGTYIEIDMDNVIYRDIFEIATSIDKLVSSGVQTVNELRHKLGETEIDEAFANIFWMTRNYSPAEGVVKELDSG